MIKKDGPLRSIKTNSVQKYLPTRYSWNHRQGSSLARLFWNNINITSRALNCEESGYSGSFLWTRRISWVLLLLLFWPTRRRCRLMADAIYIIRANDGDDDNWNW